MKKRRDQKKKRAKTISYWTENARDKMRRWVDQGVNGRRLAQLGVPLNLMTDEQRAEAAR